jgi:hypothetical protein
MADVVYKEAIMRPTRYLAAVILFVTSALLVGGFIGLKSFTSAQTSSSPAGSAIPRFRHIFLIVMENHGYDEVIGNPLAPRINHLAQSYGLATDYFGVTHPSEPNYVASIAGDYLGIQDDGPYTSHTLDGPSLASQLEKAGLTWKTYQQSLPYAGYRGTAYPENGTGLYASKHNPFLNLRSVQNSATELKKIVPDTQLVKDLKSRKVPNFSYIVPDLCHDMHGTTRCSRASTLVRAGDGFVYANVRAITRSSAWRDGRNAIVITWDEDDSATSNLGCCDAKPGGGHVPTIVIANHGPRRLKDATPYNHYSLLLTVQRAFHLACLRKTCDRAHVKALVPLFWGR